MLSPEIQPCLGARRDDIDPIFDATASPAGASCRARAVDRRRRRRRARTSRSCRRSRRRRSPTTRASSSRSILAGGNDGLNTVVPVRRPAYARAAPDAARSRTASRSAAGSALHPSLPKLKARFDQGKVAIVRGVGYQPPDLSHFTSTDIWMHGWGGSGTPTTGWLGRFLDHLPNAAHESLYGVVVARRR